MTERRRLSPMRKLKVFEDAGGLCHICGLKIFGKGWEVEHVIPLALGGADDANNMRPAHDHCHGEKTKADNASWSKAKRMKAKHYGIRKKSTWPTGRDGPFKALVGGGVERR